VGIAAREKRKEEEDEWQRKTQPDIKNALGKGGCRGWASL